MYYSDTITDPTYSSYNTTGDRIAFGDPKTPELAFTTVAEAAVAAYLMETVGGTSNPIAKDLTQRLGHMVGGDVIEAELGGLLHLEADEAREVRRTVKEVAEGSSEIAYRVTAIPGSVIRAAQQLHYGPAALEMGSTTPTPQVPKGLDLDRASEDLKTAIHELANLKEIAQQQEVSVGSHSAELAAAHVDELLDSIEHPIAA